VAGRHKSVLMKNLFMLVKTSVRIEKKNYNGDGIEAIIHVKNKMNVIFQKS